MSPIVATPLLSLNNPSPTDIGGNTLKATSSPRCLLLSLLRQAVCQPPRLLLRLQCMFRMASTHAGALRPPQTSPVTPNLQPSGSPALYLCKHQIIPIPAVEEPRRLAQLLPRHLQVNMPEPCHLLRPQEKALWPLSLQRLQFLRQSCSKAIK